MGKLAFGLLYAGVGALVTLLLHVLFPELSLFSETLTGLLIALASAGVHTLLVLRARIRRHEVRLLQVQKEIMDAMARTETLQTSFQDMDEASGTGRYESLISDVRILQSVIDRMIQENKLNLSTQRDPAAGPATAPVKLNDKEVMNLVQDALRADRIEVFLQPVVSLPQRKLRFYEMFTRIRTPDGQMLTPDRYVHLAAQGGVVSGIDNLQLLRCIQMLRDTERRNSTLRFFCNISSNTLRDTSFMTELVQFLGQNAQLAPKLIFELAQQDLATMSVDLVPVLDGLGRLGCRFSMDQVYSMDFPMAALTARKIRTVKIDADVLLEEYKKPNGDMMLRDVKNQLDRSSIDLIASKIETEGQLRELLDLNIDFGQGYLFGEPRANWPLS